MTLALRLHKLNLDSDYPGSLDFGEESIPMGSPQGQLMLAKKNRAVLSTNPVSIYSIQIAI